MSIHVKRGDLHLVSMTHLTRILSMIVICFHFSKFVLGFTTKLVKTIELKNTIKKSFIATRFCNNPVEVVALNNYAMT